MLLAEELLLLALDDRTGKNRVSNIEKGLAGAVLLELALLDRVRVTEKGEQVRTGRLVLRPGPAPGHPVLATGLEVLADREGRKPQLNLAADAREIVPKSQRASRSQAERPVNRSCFGRQFRRGDPCGNETNRAADRSLGRGGSGFVIFGVAVHLPEIVKLCIS